MTGLIRERAAPAGLRCLPGVLLLVVGLPACGRSSLGELLLETGLLVDGGPPPEADLSFVVPDLAVPVPDLSFPVPDAAGPRDLVFVVADLTVPGPDLVVRPADLAVPADLLVAVDLGLPTDLAAPADLLVVPDAPPPADLRAAPDLAMVPVDCNAEHKARPQSPTGPYLIDPDGPGGAPPFTAHCEMVTEGGGWTLALKVDGALNTFVYAAAVWTNQNTFGAADATANEAKLQPFLSVKLKELLVVMRDANADRALRVTPSGPSLPPDPTLLATFQGGGFAPSMNGRQGWLGLLANGSLQTRCGQEGVNNKVNNNNLRIGIFGNQENDCQTIDSFLGIGQDQLASGNVASAQWDDSGAGGRNTRTFSWVYVR